MGLQIHPKVIGVTTISAIDGLILFAVESYFHIVVPPDIIAYVFTISVAITGWLVPGPMPNDPPPEPVPVSTSLVPKGTASLYGPDPAETKGTPPEI